MLKDARTFMVALECLRTFLDALGRSWTIKDVLGRSWTLAKFFEPSRFQIIRNTVVKHFKSHKMFMIPFIEIHVSASRHISIPLYISCTNINSFFIQENLESKYTQKV